MKLLHQAIEWVKRGSAPITAAGEPARNEQRRRYERDKRPFEAVLSIASGSLPVQGIDLHKYGAGVISPMPLPPGSVIFIHLKTRGVVGFAHVRHCTQRGRQSFAVGLEFPTELMPKEDGAWSCQRLSAS
jgi:hypothetical protein